MGKKKYRLDLMNDRLIRPSEEIRIRIYDSVEEREWKPEGIADHGVKIPFLLKPKRERSDYAKWRAGLVKMESGDAPMMDNKGRYFETGRELKNCKFSERKLHSFDYGSNEAARTYYCQKERMDVPSMNRVMDNSHEVPGETILDRVKMGKVAGASWSSVPRLQAESSNTAHIGPGHYETHKFEAKYGPTSSNLLKLSEVSSGRGAQEYSAKTFGDFKKERNLELYREANPGAYKGDNDENVFRILSATSGLNTHGVGKFSDIDRWMNPHIRIEKYVKTTGLKLPLDYDPHLDRKRLKHIISSTPIKSEDNIPGSAYLQYEVDYGPKACMATVAKTTPVIYSQAFRSKAPVGMQMVMPTSGTEGGPGAFTHAMPEAITIKDPNKRSSTFLAPRTTCFADIPEQPGSHEQYKSFSETYTQGPFFPKGSSGADNVLREKMKHQITSLYPKLGTKIWPPPKKPMWKKDPFAHLKAKKK